MCLCVFEGGAGADQVIVILDMAPEASTGSAVSTRAFETSVKVSKKGQKNLSESNHPIGRTRSAQIMMQSLSGVDGTTYADVPTWDGCRVPWW